jgi:hypothetical protein
MVTPRHRAREKYVASGTTTDTTGFTSHYSYSETSESIDDFTGKSKRKVSPGQGLLPPSDYDHDITERVPNFMSGTSGSWTHRGAPCNAINTPGLPHYSPRGSFDRVNENAALALVLLADTHPFRYEYSVPVSIAELLDIGSLFRLAAKSFSDLVGQSYLNYRFGWVQFQQDLQTLSQITVAIERRIKEFDSLNRVGGLRRTDKLFSRDYLDQGTFWLQSSYGILCGAWWTDQTVYTIHGTVRWQWKDGIKVSLSKLEAFNTAVTAVFDIGELDASTIWNAIPWTWLVDYFYDIGNYLAAHENENLVEPYDICIMREYRVVGDYRPDTPILGNSPDLRISQGRSIRTVKSRDVITSVPTIPVFRATLISKSQALVLAALHARFRG